MMDRPYGRMYYLEDKDKNAQLFRILSQLKIEGKLKDKMFVRKQDVDKLDELVKSFCETNNIEIIPLDQMAKDTVIIEKIGQRGLA